MRTTGIVFGTTAIVILGSTLLTYTAGQRVTRARQAEEKREGAIVAIDNLFSTVQDAETGQRGFIITGDERYLEPFMVAEHNLPEALSHFRVLTDIGVSPDETATLESAVQDKLNELRRTIEERRSGGFEAAIGTIAAGSGKAAMDRIRAIVGRIRTEQETQLSIDRSGERAATRERTGTFIMCAVLTLGVLQWGHLRILRAIAERNRAMEQEQRDRELLSTTLSSIGDCVIVTDVEGRITFINPIAASVTGWAAQDAIGLPLGDVFRIINEESRQPVESPVEKVIQTGLIVGLANHTVLIRKDGTEIPIDDSGAPVRVPGGKLEGVVLVFRDFSEAKKTQRELVAARDVAESANHAKDNFLAMLSHELRTPLTPVLATLQAWELTNALGDEHKKDVYMLRRNVELEARLIDDLLDLTRISRGVLSFESKATDVHSIIDLLVAIIRSDMHRKQLDLQLALDAPNHVVKTDPSRLQQVLWNILRNAVNYTDSEGRVTISTLNQDDQVIITIEDSGVGMATDMLQRLFTPFEQADRSRSLQYGGLGLGLAISRAFLEQMGGTIEATSAGLGRGSKFEVRLTALPEGTTAQSLPRTLEPPAGPQRILLVEDHVDTAVALARLLTMRGHDVRTAASVREAEKEFEQHEFDLLICDIGLPDGTGYQLIEKLRAQDNIAAIAATGFGMHSDVARAIAAGFDAHVTKPIDLQKLETLMTHALEARRAKE